MKKWKLQNLLKLLNTIISLVVIVLLVQWVILLSKRKYVYFA